MQHLFRKSFTKQGLASILAALMEDFISNLKANIDALEDIEISGGTNFKELDGWDSIALLSAMAMVVSEYGVNVTSSEVLSCNTVEDFYKLVQSKS